MGCLDGSRAVGLVEELVVVAAAGKGEERLGEDVTEGEVLTDEDEDEIVVVVVVIGVAVAIAGAAAKEALSASSCCCCKLSVREMRSSSSVLRICSSVLFGSAWSSVSMVATCSL